MAGRRTGSDQCRNEAIWYPIKRTGIKLIHDLPVRDSFDCKLIRFISVRVRVRASLMWPSCEAYLECQFSWWLIISILPFPCQAALYPHKNEFSLRWECPILLGGQVENRVKIGKMPQSPRYLGAIFSVPPLEYQNMSGYIFLAYNIRLLLQESPKKLQKTVFLYNFPTIPPTLHLSLSLF